MLFDLHGFKISSKNEARVEILEFVRFLKNIKSAIDSRHGISESPKVGNSDLGSEILTWVMLNLKSTRIIPI